MWRTEWHLQVASLRNWLLLTLSIAGIVVLTLFLESLARGGMAPFRGFDLLRYDHRIGVRLLLGGLSLTESLHWNCRGFRDGTLRLCFFAQLPRRRFFRARLVILVVRLAVSWALMIVLALTLVLSFDVGVYPMLDGSLSVRSQLSRFLVACGQDLVAAALWTAVGFLLAVAARGRVFESALVGWLLFIAAQFLVANGAGGIGGPLGGNVATLFDRIGIDEAGSTAVLAAYLIPILLGLGAVTGGQVRFRRMNLPPNWNVR